MSGPNLHQHTLPLLFLFDFNPINYPRRVTNTKETTKNPNEIIQAYTHAEEKRKGESTQLPKKKEEKKKEKRGTNANSSRLNAWLEFRHFFPTT